MANSIGEDITGKVVEIKTGILRPEYDTPQGRLVRAESGFGCVPYTSGTAVFCTYLADGEKSRLRGYDFARVVPEDEVKQIMGTE